MVSKKVIKSVFNQCLDALSCPYHVDLVMDADKMPMGVNPSDFGGCHGDETHGSYKIFINPNVHDDIYELKNTCIHEILHTYMMPSMAIAAISIGKKGVKAYKYIHEKDISTMATCLCRTIKVKEEEVELEVFKKSS